MSEVITRKPRTAKVRGTMGKIAAEQIEGITKQPPQDQPNPLADKLDGKGLASQAINVARGEMKQGAQWPVFGRRVRALSKEARAEFITAIDAWVSSLRKAEREAGAKKDAEGKPEPSKEQAKRAAAVVASATTELSKLRTIAWAWNNQGTDEGLVDFYRGMRSNVGGNWNPDDVPHAYTYRYAVSLRGATAGRKALRFAEALARWLENNPTREAAGDDEVDNILRRECIKMAERVRESYPQEKKDPLTKAELLGTM